MERELAISGVAQIAAKVELEATLRQMKSVAVDATLHDKAELMEEFKAGKYADWGPDYEFSFRKEREVELIEAVGKGEAASNHSTPRTEIQKISKPTHVEVGPNVATHEEGMAKELSG